jgi:hypothetical protein
MAFTRNTADPQDPYFYCGGCGSPVCACDDRQLRTELEQHAWSCRDNSTSGGDRR